MTKIINQRPPIYDRLVAAGLRFNPEKTIFTYGDAIYNPACLKLPLDLIAHEEVHMRQQAEMNGGPDMWWDRYIQDPYWRIQQEAEAYAVQYRFICARKKGLDQRLRILGAIGNILGGPTYGNVITPEAAIRMIQNPTNL